MLEHVNVMADTRLSSLGTRRDVTSNRMLRLQLVAWA